MSEKQIIKYANATDDTIKVVWTEHDNMGDRNKTHTIPSKAHSSIKVCSPSATIAVYLDDGEGDKRVFDISWYAKYRDRFLIVKDVDDTIEVVPAKKGKTWEEDETF